jgi:hypothetical protein
LRYRAGGTDNTTTNYAYSYDGKFFGGGSSPVLQYYGEFGANFFLIGYGNYYSASPCIFSMDITSPQVVSETKVVGPFVSGTASNQFGGLLAGSFTATTQFDGFSIISTSGNITGNIKVYGYRNS